MKKKQKFGARAALTDELVLDDDQRAKVETWLAGLTDEQRESVPQVIVIENAQRSRKRKSNEVRCRSAPPPAREEDTDQWWAIQFREWRERNPGADEEQQLDVWRALERGRDLVDEVEGEADAPQTVVEAVALRPECAVRRIKPRDAKEIVAHVVGLPVQRVDVCGRARGTYPKRQQSMRAKKLIKKHGIDEGRLRELAKGAR